MSAGCRGAAPDGHFFELADDAFGPEGRAGYAVAFDVVAADMDLDGDADVLVNWHHTRRLALFENVDGAFRLANPSGNDASGLYDNAGVPDLYADRERMLRLIRQGGTRPAAYVWHDVSRTGSWRLAWVDPQPTRGLRLQLETSVEIAALEGLSPGEQAAPQRRAPRTAVVELAAGGGLREIGVRTKPVAVRLALDLRATGGGDDPDVLVGPALTPLAGPRLELWKADPHGIAWVDALETSQPDLYITRGGLGGRLRPPAQPKRDRFYVASEPAAAGSTRYRMATDGVVPQGYGRGRRVEWADVDADGRLELAVGNRNTPNVLLVWDADEERFHDRAATFDLAMMDGDVFAWIDHDGDGYDDIVYLSGGSLRLARNVDGRRFRHVDGASLGLVLPPSAPAAGLFDRTAVRVADFDSDGNLDIWVVGYGQARGSRLFRRDGDGYTDVTEAVGLDGVSGHQAVVLLDLDDDGFEDAVSFGSTATVWHNDSGRLFTFRELDLDSAIGTIHAATALDADADGRTDIVAVGRRPYLLRNVARRNNGHVDVTLQRFATGHGAPVGAVVRAHLDDGRVIAQRYGSARNSAFSQSLQPLRFGLPRGTEITAVDVQWRGHGTPSRQPRVPAAGATAVYVEPAVDERAP